MWESAIAISYYSEETAPGLGESKAREMLALQRAQQHEGCGTRTDREKQIPRADFVDAQKLLMSMTFARRSKNQDAALKAAALRINPKTKADP
jgi:hypothetical protein